MTGKRFGDLAGQGEFQGGDVLHHHGLTLRHRNPKSLELVWVGTSTNPDVKASARDLVNGCDLADPLLALERRALVASYTALRRAVGT